MNVIKKILVFSLALLVISCKTEKQQQPNVIYIFPDQYRNYSLGFWSQGENEKYLQGAPDPVNTPELDKLANEGIVLNRAVSNYPLCSPYRGMLLSGMYPNMNGVRTNCRNDRPDHLNSDAECITDVFSDAGYHIAYFGKCHWIKNDSVFTKEGTYVGTKEEPGGYGINRYDTYVPPGKDRHSIDYFLQLLGDTHKTPTMYSNDPKAVDGKKDGELHKGNRFSAEIEAENIINYLDNTHGQRETDKPFFVMWALNPPHNPWDENSTKMEYFDQYTEDGAVNVEKLLARDNADTAVGNYVPYYFANVSAVDYCIGTVLKRLEEKGLMENTIVVFTSDHGEMLGSHALRGKNVPEIEAFNIPFILKWKGKLQHRVDDLILSVPDVMPTLLGLAGLKEKIPAAVQGTDYSQNLLENGGPEKPKSALFLNWRSRGVYTGKYMFVVHQKDGKLAEEYYYDNVNDPYQLTKLDPKELNEYQSLKAELKRLLVTTKDEWVEKKICDDYFSYQQ